jgi:hypothetical protein
MEQLRRPKSPIQVVPCPGRTAPSAERDRTGVPAERLPDTLELIRAWGFRYVSSGLVWVKTTKSGNLRFGTGFYTRKSAEFLLLAKRGNGLVRRDRGVPEVIMAPRRAHSHKPDEAESWAVDPDRQHAVRSGDSCDRHVAELRQRRARIVFLRTPAISVPASRLERERRVRVQ